MLRRSLVPCLLLVLAAACGPTVRPGPSDARTDTGADAAGDVAADRANPDVPTTDTPQPPDAQPDAPPDTACPMGQMRCGASCVDVQTDNANCGTCGTACGADRTCTAGACVCSVMGQTACGMSCVNLMTDPANCGMCGAACPGGQMCVAGVCQIDCPSPNTRCTAGGMMTCVDAQTDNANCGSCGNVCPTGQMCVAGACMCGAGTTLCGGACVNTASDNANCGSCGNACPAGRACVAGACACAAPTTLCGGACVNTLSDNANCGSCGNACPMGRTCVAGGCECVAGTTLCGTTCVNTATDANNCGACGRACGAGRPCVGGVCQCAAGQTLCGTTCTDLQTDRANCGACGRACAGTETCVAGACRTSGPPNDTRAGAEVINLAAGASINLSANTAMARNDTTGTCGCTGGNDVFYRFTLTVPELVYADTVGATWDTSLFLQDSAGNNIADAGTPGGATCNDDNGLGCGTGLQTMIAARLNPGTYFLVLSGCGNGAATIHFHHLPASNGPVTRIMPTLGRQMLTGTTAGVGLVTSPCCSGGPENMHWFVTCPGWSATAFNATTCGTGATFDTEIDVRSATRVPVSQCNDDSCGLLSNVDGTIPAGPGLHAVYADGCGSGAGAYTINFTIGSACPAGQTSCGGMCVNTQTDTRNCGSCGTVCGLGQVCQSGVCTFTTRYTQVVSPPGVTFINACSAPGATMHLSGVDDGQVLVPLPFAFRYWATNLPAGQQINITSNGWIGMDGVANASLGGTIPSASAPNAVIAAHWGDNVNTGAQCAATIGTAPNRQWVHTWNAHRYFGGGGSFTYSIILTETSNTIDIVYGTMSGTRSQTAGIENQTGTAGVGACPGGAFSCAPTSGYAVRFQPVP